MDHTLKGCVGARFEQIKNLVLRNFTIKNLVNYAKLNDCNLFPNKLFNKNEIDKNLKQENTWLGTFDVINTSCILKEKNVIIKDLISKSKITKDKIEINISKSSDLTPVKKQLVCSFNNCIYYFYCRKIYLRKL